MLNFKGLTLHWGTGNSVATTVRSAGETEGNALKPTRPQGAAALYSREKNTLFRKTPKNHPFPRHLV
jgi:hypothetical protein